jgi:ATP-dependent helicase/nuclease subunit A
VCREHPTEADVPPDFAILDELEGSIWLAEHCDDALSALPAHVVTALPYATLRDCIAELLKEPDAAEAALAVGHEGWPDLARSHQQRALARLLALSGWRDACSVLTRYQGEGGDKREVARQHALACVRALESGAVKEAIAHLARTNLQGGKKSAWPNGGLDEVKGAIFTARDCLSAAIEEGLDLELGPADEHLAARLVALTEAFTAVWAHLRRVKRAARVLDYADLLSYARQALAHPHVREHYAGMWRAFLIDEVQDTSPAQANLLLGLSAHATVTIVGDEKQSIYGFLGADETVFARMQEHVTTTGGSTVTLSDSFRTHASLMSALNTLTSPLLGEMNQPLIATRAAPSDGPHVTAYAVTCDASNGSPSPSSPHPTPH